MNGDWASICLIEDLIWFLSVSRGFFYQFLVSEGLICKKIGPWMNDHYWKQGFEQYFNRGGTSVKQDLIKGLIVPSWASCHFSGNPNFLEKKILLSVAKPTTSGYSMIPGLTTAYVLTVILSIRMPVFLLLLVRTDAGIKILQFS